MRIHDHVAVLAVISQIIVKLGDISLVLVTPFLFHLFNNGQRTIPVSRSVTSNPLLCYVRVFSGEVVYLPKNDLLPVTLRSREYEVFTVVPLKHLPNGAIVGETNRLGIDGDTRWLGRGISSDRARAPHSELDVGILTTESQLPHRATGVEHVEKADHRKGGTVWQVLERDDGEHLVLVRSQ